MEKLTLKEIAECTNSDSVCDGFVTSVCIDNRLAEKGSLFVAIKGENNDGHKYAKEACERGSSAALVSMDSGCDKQIFVSDTKKALGDIARYYLKKHPVKVIAVTGSVGKTTTRDMTYAAVNNGMSAIKTEKNFNNDIGLPLTVLNSLKDCHKAAILEMGMNHFGEIDYLAKIARPDIAIITNIGMSHIENLGSREGILKAKLEVCNGLAEDGVLVLNGDDEYLVNAERYTDKNIVMFGINNPNVRFKAKNISQNEEILSFDICFDNKKEKISINCRGIHNVYNALAAFAAAVLAGVSPKLAAEGIEKFVPTAMRMELFDIENTKIINDCYNASPDSMRAAISVLSDMKEEKKIAILGDMLEMGSFAPKAHRQIGEFAKEKKIDMLLCTGELGKYIKDGFGDAGLWFETQENLLGFLKNEVLDNSCVLIKASRGMHFEKITDAIKNMKG